MNGIASATSRDRKLEKDLKNTVETGRKDKRLNGRKILRAYQICHTLEPFPRSAERLGLDKSLDVTIHTIIYATVYITFIVGVDRQFAITCVFSYFHLLTPLFRKNPSCIFFKFHIIKFINQSYQHSACSFFYTGIIFLTSFRTHCFM